MKMNMYLSYRDALPGCYTFEITVFPFFCVAIYLKDYFIPVHRSMVWR